jgi:hypothetical protein
MATIISVALVFLGCSQQSKTTTNQNIALNDKSQIKVAAYGYLIEKEFNRSTNTLFVSADKDELGVISAKFPNHRIKPATQAEITTDNRIHRVQDKISKEEGVVLEVKQIEIKGQKAEAFAGYFSGAGITFNFAFKRDNGWHIETVSPPMISDP